MRVALFCRDKPGAFAVRMENRAAHLAYLEASGVVEMAGPLIEDGEMRGSLAILSVDDLDAARAFSAADPYTIAGLFADVQIVEWKKVIG